MTVFDGLEVFNFEDLAGYMRPVDMDEIYETLEEQGSYGFQPEGFYNTDEVNDTNSFAFGRIDSFRQEDLGRAICNEHGKVLSYGLESIE